jgi:hypothetical protein
MKVFARCKHSSLFGLAVSDEEKTVLKHCHQVSSSGGEGIHVSQEQL